MLRTNTKFQQLIKHAKICYSIVSLVFCKFLYQTYRNDLNRLPQMLQTVLVRYLFSEICILVYSYTGCGTSKICLCLENNRLLFSRVGLKSETKDVCP